MSDGNSNSGDTPEPVPDSPSNLGWPYSQRISFKDLEPGRFGEDMDMEIILRLTHEVSGPWTGQKGSLGESWPAVPAPPTGFVYVCNPTTGELYFQPDDWSVDPIPQVDLTVPISLRHS